MPALTKEQIFDGNFAVLSLLTAITCQKPFSICEEQEVVRLFVLATADNPEEPLVGSELWVSLKQKFPTKEGGIDTNTIAKKMAQILMKEMGM